MAGQDCYCPGVFKTSGERQKLRQMARAVMVPAPRCLTNGKFTRKLGLKPRASSTALIS